MLGTRSQEVVDRILQSRIALLAEIIRTGSYQSIELAAIRLAEIGTKQAADTLIDLIKTHKDGEASVMLLGSVILFRNRDDYREELEALEGVEEVGEAYADLEEIDPRLFEKPFWLTVAKELEMQFEKDLRNADPDAVLYAR